MCIRDRFSAVADPVAAGLVDAFDRTTGNITGVSNGIDVAKIFALADELTQMCIRDSAISLY